MNKTDRYKQSIDLQTNAFILENDSVLTKRVNLRIFLSDDMLKIVEGDSILVNGKISIPEGENNPGGFNFINYYRSERIDGFIRSRDIVSIKVLSKGKGSNVNVFKKIHLSIQQKLEEHLSISNVSLINALLLGNRGGLTEDSKELFRKNGVVHLLAVSGLHVGYIIVILFLTGSVLRLNREIILYLILIGIIFYAALLGWRTPITRAVIMGSILLLGGLTERRSLPLNSLGIAALLILIFKPYALFEVGFQLSFMAVGSILFFNMRYGDLIPLPNPVNLPKKVLRWVMEFSLLTLYALIGTIPLTLFHFNTFSTGAFFLNIIIIPYVGVLIALSIIAITFSYIYQPVGAVFFS
ncbi:ComEC family competence protein [Candidatus Marinimicrobia bacterium MT.SAG.4]|nr:ComEC family competence protein [Candidatus Marinimicrobia bacterium MT.SAG.4]